MLHALPFSKATYLIYVALLEQDGYINRAICGSMSSKNSGAYSRTKNWLLGDLLPTRVKELVSEGYEVVHVGLVATMPKPDVIHRHPETRCWVLLLELMFSVFFWTFWQAADKDLDEREQHFLAAAYEFDLDEFDYEGCCTHSSLAEGPSGLNLSVAERAQHEEERRARSRRPNMSEEQLEKVRAYQRVENMTEEQIMKQNSKRDRLTEAEKDKRQFDWLNEILQGLSRMGLELQVCSLLC